MKYKCKNCKIKWDHWTQKIYWIHSFCSNTCIDTFLEENKPKMQKRVPIKAISDKKKRRLNEFGWEMELFYKKIDSEIQEKWEIRCQNPYCNRLLDKNSLWPASFPHLLSKWMYPQYRYFLNNLTIVCNDLNMNSCHTKIDEIISWNKLQIEKDVLDWKRIDFNNYKKLANN